MIISFLLGLVFLVGFALSAHVKMNISQAALRKDYALVKDIFLNDYEANIHLLCVVTSAIQADLLRAAVSGDLETTEAILAIPFINVNHDDELVLSAMADSPEMFFLFLAHESFIPDRPLFKYGEKTILHFAVIEGIFYAVEALLSRDDVSLNALDVKGYTPLIYAVSCERSEIVEAIINHPRFDASDSEFEYAFNIAKLTRNENLLQVFSKFSSK